MAVIGKPQRVITGIPEPMEAPVIVTAPAKMPELVPVKAPEKVS